MAAYRMAAVEVQEVSTPRPSQAEKGSIRMAFFQLTRRTAEPSAPSHPAQGGYSALKSLCSGVMDAIKSARPYVAAHTDLHERIQSSIPLNERPNYGDPTYPERPDPADGKLGGRGSGHQGNEYVGPTRPGTSGRVGGTAQQYSGRYNPVPTTTRFPPTLD